MSASFKQLQRITVGNYSYLEYEVVRSYKHHDILRLPYIMVEFLYTAVSQRRQGHASKLLNAIKAIGDNLNMPVIVQCQPYGENKPDKRWLIKFYAKHGFTPSFFDYMEYKPRKHSGNLPMVITPPPVEPPTTVHLHPSLDTQFYEAA